MLTGHVTWLYAFDIAHDMRREPLKTVLGRPVEPWLLATDIAFLANLSFTAPKPYDSRLWKALCLEAAAAT